MAEDSYRSSHLGLGADYHAMFSDRRDVAVQWCVEQALLDSIVEQQFQGAPFRYLDFACGTGRVLEHVHRHTPDATGVDVSPSMMEQARARMPDVRLIQADLTREAALDDEQFDLITAFRFFPNAEDEVRQGVMAALVQRLAPGGLLVFNNHQNSRGLRRRLVHAVGRDPGHEMRPDEVQALVTAHGLCVRARHGVGLLPLSHRLTPRPIRWVAALERALSDTQLSQTRATSVLFECTHDRG